jgi:hypothetical protein
MPVYFTIMAQTDETEGEIRLTDNTGSNMAGKYTPPGEELFIEVTETSDPQHITTSWAALPREQVEVLYDYLAGWLGKDKLVDAAREAVATNRKAEESYAESYERHPRLEPGECSCGGSGAMDGHAYNCNLRRGV